MNNYGKSFQHRGIIKVVVLALIFSALLGVVLVTPRSADKAYAANNTSGAYLASIAQQEFAASSRSNFVKYGEKYWTWACKYRGATPKKEDWCGEFTAWCAQQAGLFDAGIYTTNWKEFISVPKLLMWFQKHSSAGELWINDGSYIPRAGDLAIQYINNKPSHIEIVISGDAKKRGNDWR